MSFDFDDSIDDLKYDFSGNKEMPRVDNYYHNTPLFSYDFVDLQNTDYNFTQKVFDNTDLIIYFEKVKEISKKTINDLIDNSSHNLHFHVYNTPNGKLLKLIKQVLNIKTIRIEEMPVAGQFALYTNENANRDKNVKSPRIFFLIGPNAVFYLLFYDPYHEIRK